MLARRVLPVAARSFAAAFRPNTVRYFSNTDVEDKPQKPTIDKAKAMPRAYFELDNDVLMLMSVQVRTPFRRPESRACMPVAGGVVSALY